MLGRRKGPNLGDRKETARAQGIPDPSYRGIAGLPMAMRAIIGFKYAEAPNEHFMRLKETAKKHYADVLAKLKKAGVRGWKISLGQRAELIRFLTRPVSELMKENNVLYMTQMKRVTISAGRGMTTRTGQRTKIKIEKFMKEGEMKIKVSIGKST